MSKEGRIVDQKIEEIIKERGGKCRNCPYRIGEFTVTFPAERTVYGRKPGAARVRVLCRLCTAGSLVKPVPLDGAECPHIVRANHLMDTREKRTMTTR